MDGSGEDNKNTARKTLAEADFFISRAGADKALACWVAALLGRQGATSILQDNDFGPGDFAARIHEALSSNPKIIALLSPDYLVSDWCKKEAFAALSGDPLNKAERLAVIRVRPAPAVGLFANLNITSILPELRQGDATALARKILKAAGFAEPKLDGLPPPPPDLLAEKAQILHPEIRENPNFAGREEHLTALAAKASSSHPIALTNSRHVTQAVRGGGGVGKSLLAREFGWRHRTDYEGVWWLNAATPDGIAQGLIKLGTLFNPGPAKEGSSAEAAREALNFIEDAGFEKPWLLIYDNVEKPGDLHTLTPRTGAHVLLTTRWRDWTGEAEPLDVDVFEPAFAARFLCERAGRNEPEDAAALARDLGYLPLALDHAAAYCRNAPNISFAAYRENIAALIRKAPPPGAQAMQYEASVYATFSLALDRVISGDEARGHLPCAEAGTLMSLIAFLGGEPIPLNLFGEEILEPLELADAVAALTRYSLSTPVTMDGGEAGISVHRLVQMVMRQRLAEHGEAEAFAGKALALVADAFPCGEGGNAPDDVRSWPACARLYPHAIAVLETAPEIGEMAAITALLCNQMGLYLDAQANYAEAEPLMRLALAIDEKAYGSNHSHVAIALNNLAGLLKDTHRLAEAEPLLKRVVEIFEKVERDPCCQHPNYAGALNNLAEFLHARNRLTEAGLLFRRALAIGEAIFGPDHPNVATSLNNLALLLKATNRLVEAEPLYRRALAIDEKAYGLDHPNVARDLNNLAGLLKDTHRLAEAEILYRRALAIVETSLPDHHPWVQKSRANLAALLTEMGKP